MATEMCRSIVIGVHESNVGDCIDNRTVSLHDVVDKCQTLAFRLALYWIQLLLKEYYRECSQTDRNYTIRYYDNNNYTALFRDLSTGNIDLYPFEMMINLQSFDKKMYYTTPLWPSNYHFYTNQNLLRRNAMAESPMTFLTSPFGPTVWIVLGFCMGAFGFINYAKNQMVTRRRRGTHHNHTVLTALDRISLVLMMAPLAALAVCYSSVLKALVTQPSVTSPFDSIAQLADRIRHRQLKILIENPFSLRRKMLTSSVYNRSPQFEILYKAVQQTQGSLIYGKNMLDVCHRLESSTNYVYFGFDGILMTTCNQSCFWKFRPKEEPDQWVSFVVSRRNGKLMQLADLFSHAVPIYRQMEINRRYKPACGKTGGLKTNFKNISMNSLKTAFFLLIAFCWSAGILLMLAEILTAATFRSRSRRN